MKYKTIKGKVTTSSGESFEKDSLAIDFCCERMKQAWGEEITHNSKGIVILSYKGKDKHDDPVIESTRIEHCPWCGAEIVNEDT